MAGFGEYPICHFAFLRWLDTCMLSAATSDDDFVSSNIAKLWRFPKAYQPWISEWASSLVPEAGVSQRKKEGTSYQRLKSVSTMTRFRALPIIGAARRWGSDRFAWYDFLLVHYTFSLSLSR